MRLALLCALALTALFSTPALAGDPVTCRYSQAALAAACREQPEVRRYLMERENAGVVDLMDIPPSVRGWAPGEQAALDRVLGIQRTNTEAGCDYDDTLVALACRTNPLARERLAAMGRGRASSWFVLGPEIGGYPPDVMNMSLLSRDPSAAARAMSWNLNLDMKETRIDEVTQVLERALQQRVVLARLSIISIDARNFVACGYAFTDGGGYEAESSGAFVFDTRGNSAIRATPQMMRQRCSAADAVLR